MDALISLTRWAPLSLFGNSMLARLVLLTPAVALFVRLQEDYLEQTFGLTHAVWLYWSLIFISVGQILFAWRCPQLIKKYGRDSERFKVEDASARTDHARSILRRDQVRSLFKEHGGVLERRTYENQTAAERYLADHFPKTPVAKLGSEMLAFLRHYVAKDGTGFSFNVGAVKQLASSGREALATNSDDPEAGRALDYLVEITDAAARDRNNQGSQREWDLLALDWEYDTANRSRRYSRGFVSALYAAGSLYFLYSGARGIVIMGAYTLAFLTGTPPEPLHESEAPICELQFPNQCCVACEQE